MVVVTEDSSLYLFHEHGLSTTVLGTGMGEDRLLNSLIMNDDTQLAEHLCVLNGWEKSSLRLHALDMGLR
jgi:spatacsin